MLDIEEKKYPSATPEIARIFGMEGGSHLDESEAASSHGDLPIVDVTAPKPAKAEQHGHSRANGKETDAERDLFGRSPARAGFALRFIKAAGPYAAVFAVGIFLYYFFFSSVDLGSLFKTQPKVASAKESALQQLQKTSLASYYQWIGGFYFDVSDPGIIDPNADISGNGLSNFQKYLLNLNPKSYDTLGLGRADSETLAAGINPLSGNLLTDGQKQIIDKYFDMEVIMNRLTLSKLHQGNASDTPVRYNLNGNASGGNSVSSGTAPDSSAPVEPITNLRGGPGPSIVAPTVAQMPAPTPPPPATQVNYALMRNSPTVAYAQDPLSDQPLSAADLQIDTSIPGRLEVPSLKVNAPLMWTTDAKNFDNDLQKGVIHYPGTAMPGQIGTTYISGHSSNYVWAKGSYNRVFSTLGSLPDNASFKITVVQKNGKDAILHYIVTSSKQFSPTDSSQFDNSAKSVVALSTCWPVNTTQKRLVVFGELTQVEK